MNITRFDYLAVLLAMALLGPAQASVFLSPEMQTTIISETPAHKEFRKGISALLSSRLTEAEQAFLASSKLDPGFAAPLLGLADVELKKKRPTAAAKWLAAADKAEPNSVQVKLAWGRYYRTQQQYAKAEAMLTKSIEIKPSAAAYLELAFLYLADQKNPRAALEASEKSISLAPTNPAVRYALAMSLSANGMGDRAMQEFEQVTRLQPDNPEAWRAIGRLHAEKGRFPQAAVALDRAIKLQPTNTAILVDRGDVAVAMNSSADAIRFFELAIKQQPDSAPLFAKLGLVYQINKRAKESETAYLKAIQLDPRSADPYNNLAWLVIADTARQEQALKWAEKANQIAPNTPVYLDTLGWLHHLSGNSKKAEQLLLKAADLKPELSDVHYHLGLIYAKQGKKNEAVAAFKRALAINPNFTYSSEAKKSLGEIK